MNDFEGENAELVFMGWVRAINKLLKMGAIWNLYKIQLYTTRISLFTLFIGGRPRTLLM